MATFGRTGVTSFVSRKDPDKEDTGIVEEDVRKVSVFFINSLHHNNGYFLTVSVDVKDNYLLSQLITISVCVLRDSEHDCDRGEHLSDGLFPRGKIYEVSKFVSKVVSRTNDAKFSVIPEQCLIACWMCRYGSQVVNYLGHDRVARLDKPNPLCTVFPTVTRRVYAIISG